MFIRWKKLKLTDASFREDMLCPHTEPGRHSLRPVLMASFRDDSGTPRHRILWRPGKTIHSCCVAETIDAVARAEWWSYIWHDISELEAQCKKRGFRYLKPIAEAQDSIIAMLEKIVPLPEEEDWDLYAAWEKTDAGWHEDETSFQRYKRRLEEAKKLLATAKRDGALNGMSQDKAAALLGVTLPTTEIDLRAAFRKAALKHHPDRGGSEEMFVMVRAAYEKLAATVEGTS